MMKTSVLLVSSSFFNGRIVCAITEVRVGKYQEIKTPSMSKENLMLK